MMRDNEINLSAREICYNFNCWTRSRQGYINNCLSNWIFMIYDFGLSYSWGNQLPYCTRQKKEPRKTEIIWGENYDSRPLKLWFHSCGNFENFRVGLDRGKDKFPSHNQSEEKTPVDRFTYSILLLQTTHSRFSPMYLPSQHQCSTLNG